MLGIHTKAIQVNTVGMPHKKAVGGQRIAPNIVFGPQGIKAW